MYDYMANNREKHKIEKAANERERGGERGGEFQKELRRKTVFIHITV